jgi:hypothetical protein
LSRGARRQPLDFLPRRILAGAEERIFEVLPPRVLENLRKPASENALLWNLIYPLARPHLQLSSLLALRPLWGGSLSADDSLKPYFWGYSLEGEPLRGLFEAIAALGQEQKTEADLFLVGSRTLILVEVKNLSNLGRCGRYARGVCPEIHVEDVPQGATCRYWDVPEARFDRAVDFGPRPTAETERPP